MTWKTAFSFVALASGLTVFVGWLITVGGLPIEPSINYTDAGLRFIRVWIWLAISLGLLLPLIAFVIWNRDPEPRKILGLYLSVLIIQIVTEQVVSIWLPSLVVTVGTLYTVFRIWQLWQGRQLMQTTVQERSSHKIIHSLLWLLLLFWTSNLIMLLMLGWPSIL